MSQPEPLEDLLRRPAEQQYARQLEALAQHDTDPRPPAWRLSPRGVLRYITGGETLELKTGRKKTPVTISRKFYGDDRLVQRAIVTLASERALLLLGPPGTGKSWLSEHLAAAVSGDSTLIVQGTAGTTEEHIKYGWNIARVIAEGYRRDNLVPAPTLVAMEQGAILRFEEITRCLPDVQDALVSLLSEKTVAVPELPQVKAIWAKPGFNVIATANDRDQGINELSAALKRRFNYVYVPVVDDLATEAEIVQRRCGELLERYHIPLTLEPELIYLLTTVFQELRTGRSREGVSLKSAGTTLSTAEAIGVTLDAALNAHYFGNRQISPADLGHNLVGVAVKEDRREMAVLEEYLALLKNRRHDGPWQEFARALGQALG